VEKASWRWGVVCAFDRFIQFLFLFLVRARGEKKKNKWMKGARA
jgi:hypothetical protein